MTWIIYKGEKRLLVGDAMIAFLRDEFNIFARDIYEALRILNLELKLTPY